jgi:hypothetical protein
MRFAPGNGGGESTPGVEIQALVLMTGFDAFLEVLTDEEFLRDPRFSDPFAIR